MDICIICVTNMTEHRGRYQVLGTLEDVTRLVRDAEMDGHRFVSLTGLDGSTFVMSTRQIESISALPEAPAPKDETT
jgi:hypothetical protein